MPNTPAQVRLNKVIVVVFLIVMGFAVYHTYHPAWPHTTPKYATFDDAWEACNKGDSLACDLVHGTIETALHPSEAP